MEPRSQPELHNLLAQLAQFFRANETRISVEQATRCFQCLSAVESSALKRLFSLLYRKKTPPCERQQQPAQNEILQGSMNSNSHGAQCQAPAKDGIHIPTIAESLNGCSNGQSQERQPYLSTIFLSENHLHASEGGGQSNHEILLALETLEHPVTDCLGFGEQEALPHAGSSSTIVPALLTSGTAAARNAPPTDVSAREANDVPGRTGLALCSEIKFAPSTRRLLEDCRANRGKFLCAIKESRAAFPTGQGWEAAIATKKENTDIRDLMRIYHRFECYNIYWHVVEAGYHTGTHWIREMRAVLTDRLCQSFPERFPDHKSANKCLNWVDQGCKYHEWTEVLSDVPNLGILIALPADVSHSAYTSRCSKEQMSAAASKFVSLGINELVDDLGLSELGGHIAARLRDMTQKKRKHVNEETTQRCLKIPRLTLPEGVLEPTPRPSQPTTSPGPIADANHSLDGHVAPSITSCAVQELSVDCGRRDHPASDPLMDCSAVPFGSSNVESNSPTSSDLFTRQDTEFELPDDEWYSVSSSMEDSHHGHAFSPNEDRTAIALPG